jgi:uncharacterized membrane protein
MVRAKQEGRDPDPGAGLRGKLRSVHNTYFTLPVLFTMISNHYALTFGARYNWLVLIAMSAAGVLIRVYFVARHKRHERGGQDLAWPASSACRAFAARAAPAPQNLSAALAQRPLRERSRSRCVRRRRRRARRPSSGGFGRSPAAAVRRHQAIVAARCAPCHAAVPTQPGFATAPKGLLLDSPRGLL